MHLSFTACRADALIATPSSLPVLATLTWHVDEGLSQVLEEKQAEGGLLALLSFSLSGELEKEKRR